MNAREAARRILTLAIDLLASGQRATECVSEAWKRLEASGEVPEGTAVWSDAIASLVYEPIGGPLPAHSEDVDGRLSRLEILLQRVSE